MSGSPHQHPAFSLPPDDALDALVNEVIDAESAGRDALALTLVRKGVAEFPGFGAHLAATRAAVKGLRSPVFVPDQRGEVLVEVHTLRPFLTRRDRRQLSMSRLAIAAGVVITATLLMVLQRTYPGMGAEGPAPVGTLVDASRADASASVQMLAGAVADLKQEIGTPVSTVLNAGEPPVVDTPLSFGSIARYEYDTPQRSPMRVAPAVQFPRGKAFGGEPALAAGDLAPAQSDRPLMLLQRSDPAASVRALPWAGLYIDEDGVVLFTQPLRPQAPTPVGVLR